MKIGESLSSLKASVKRVASNTGSAIVDAGKKSVKFASQHKVLTGVAGGVLLATGAYVGYKLNKNA